jgi:hypothetical protein
MGFAKRQRQLTAGLIYWTIWNFFALFIVANPEVCVGYQIRNQEIPKALSYNPPVNLTNTLKRKGEGTGEVDGEF